MTTLTSAPPPCEAKTGFRAGEWTELPVYCNATVGLTSWTDARGMTHRACRHHRSQMLYRYPAADPAPRGCVVCGRAVVEELAISVEWGARIGLVCHVCQERGDER